MGENKLKACCVRLWRS